MKTTCPTCSQSISIDPETLSSLQGNPHFECPACSGAVSVPLAYGSQPVAPVRDPDAEATSLLTPLSDADEAAPLASAHRGMNRNLLILGSAALLVLGGIAVFLASHSGGNTFRTNQNITNQIIHNTYFTQLIASGETTEKDLNAIAEIRPRGDGFIGISKESLTWDHAQELAKRTGAEILAVENGPAASGTQLLAWLGKIFSSHLSTTVWVSEQGAPRVLDGTDILAVTAKDRQRKAVLQWRPRSSAHPPAQPDTASKDRPFVNSMGMKFVPLPVTGGPTSGKTILVSIWETRVQDYELFAGESKRDWPDPGFSQGADHPAAKVSWDDAQAFCRWLTEREKLSGRIGENDCYRLPSDHEWSCAVGIGNREIPERTPLEKVNKIANVFPWGGGWPPPAGSGNFLGKESIGHLIISGRKPLADYQDEFIATSPVASFSPNFLGIYDLSGNALEWCEDWFDLSQKKRVLRGGGWYLGDRSWLLSSTRGCDSPGSRFAGTGFRCVLDLADKSPAGKTSGISGIVRQ